MPGWTPEQIELLMIMWPLHSASHIASHLKVSRNAVIGKAHRLGLHTLEKRPPPKPPPKIPRPRLIMKPPVEKPKTVVVEKIVFVEDPSSAVSLMDLDHYHCRAIVGKDNDNLATYCGRPKIDGISYCADHARIFYIQPRR